MVHPNGVYSWYILWVCGANLGTDHHIHSDHLLYAVMRSITKVIQYIHKYETQVELFINSDFGSSTRGERHNSEKSMLTMLSEPISTRGASRDVKISDGWNPKKPTASYNGREFNSLPQWQKLNWRLFQTPQILPGMTSSTLQPHFLSKGLSWQWRLSYPLCASVKLHLMTMHLNF